MDWSLHRQGGGPAHQLRIVRMITAPTSEPMRIGGVHTIIE
jgi:hypothetical protein